MKPIYGYICASDLHDTAWIENEKSELPELFKTVKELKKHRSFCWKECGIAKIELKFIKVITNGKI